MCFWLLSRSDEAPSNEGTHQGLPGLHEHEHRPSAPFMKDTIHFVSFS